MSDVTRRNFFSAESKEEKSATFTKLLVEFLFLLGFPRPPYNDFREKSDASPVCLVCTSLAFVSLSSFTFCLHCLYSLVALQVGHTHPAKGLRTRLSIRKLQAGQSSPLSG